MRWLRFIKLSPVILIISSMLPILTGCWDKLEVEETAYIAVIGLDKYDSDKMEVTYVVPNPQGGGFSSVIGSTSQEPPEEIVTIKGADVLTARDLLGTSVTRQISFAHTRTLVVSEELAKSTLFYRSLEGLVRDRQARRDINIIVCREKASEFIRNNNSQMETKPHKFYEFMARRWEEIALVPLTNINEFIVQTANKQELFLNPYGTVKTIQPIVEGFEDNYLPGEINKSGGNPIQIIGAAVFQNGVMLGAITGEETRLCQLLSPGGIIHSSLTTYPDPLDKKYRLSMRIIKEQKNRIKMDLSGERLKIDVRVPVLYDILAVPSGIDYVVDMEKQKFLREYITQQLNYKALRLVNKMQSEFKGDPFMWSTVIRKKFRTWDEFQQYEYGEKFVDADILVNFDLKLRRAGKNLKPFDFDNTRSNEE